jgi:F-type H+-transporting ATPase subunit c
MNSVRVVRQVLLIAIVFAAVSSSVVFAQGEGAAAPTAVLHYFGAALGLGMIVIGAALGIGKFAAAAAEGIARQPAAADKITGAVNLPLFLLEGVAILAEVFVLLIVLMR